MAMKKHRLSPKQSKLLKRIEKTARSAAVERLRGRVDIAMRHDRNLDLLLQRADDERLGGAGVLREERGRQRGHALESKVTRYGKGINSPRRF